MSKINDNKNNAKNVLSVTQDEVTQFNIVENSYNNEGKHLPMGIKVGRNIETYRMSAERELHGSITDIAEEMRREINEGEINEGKGKEPTVNFDGVSLLLIKKTNLMLLFDLFDTSVKYGHEKTNTGIVDENGILPNGDSVGSVRLNGINYFHPVILKSFKELAKEVFNSIRPNKKEKEALFKVLELMSRKQYNDGTIRTDKLISYTTTRKNNDLFLKIVFHPIYALDSYTNYGALPRDLIERLNKVCKRLKCRLSCHTLDILSIISRMEAGIEYRRYEVDIMEEINQMDYYEEHKGLAVRNLKTDLKVLEGIGMIEAPIFSERPDGTFYIVKKRVDFCTPEAEISKRLGYLKKLDKKGTKNKDKQGTKKEE